ncbi:hypothetical protein Tsubulata_041409 [Turnera subulata]|uniref:DUF4283 domain-containing protein n=1 Tax=Turnera subulata TaxID=218843 RepID=A0A9Q0J0L9_9ROSI|nr:hypothetical protein Tsubulata_041409 [Turnera subulata]
MSANDLTRPNDRVRERSSTRRVPNPQPIVQQRISPGPPGDSGPDVEGNGVPIPPEEDGRSLKKVRTLEPLGQSESDAMLTDPVPEITISTPTQAPPVADAVMDEPRSSYLDMFTGGDWEPTMEDPWAEEEEAEYEEGDIVVVEKDSEEVVELSDAFLSRLRKPWERAVVVKLMGRAIALLDGPWSIYNNVLSVQPWTQSFRASSTTIDKVVTWVHFLDFPLDQYHSRILLTMGNLVGKAVKLEKNSENPSRGKFAKVVVCVDVTKPLKGMVTVDNKAYKVMYEGLPDICGVYGRFGHLSISWPNGAAPPSLCPTAINQINHPSSSPPSAGTSHRPPKRQVDGQPLPKATAGSPFSGNRFQPLYDSESAVDTSNFEASAPENPSFSSPKAQQKSTKSPTPHRPPARTNKPLATNTKLTGSSSVPRKTRPPLNNITNKPPTTSTQAQSGSVSPSPQPKVLLTHNPNMSLNPRPLTNTPLPPKPKHSSIKLSEANDRDIFSVDAALSSSSHPTPPIQSSQPPPNPQTSAADKESLDPHPSNLKTSHPQPMDITCFEDGPSPN